MTEIQTPPSIVTGQPVAPIPSNPTSTKSMMALILGILSLLCCGFCSGIPAIVIGRAEMKAMAEGLITPASGNMAKIGMILGIIGTVLSGLSTLVYIFLLALGLSSGLMDQGMN